MSRLWTAEHEHEDSTLIESMIVVTIIGILAVVMVPDFIPY